MILGVDPGERRVGVAIADDETRFARPLEVIDVREMDPAARIAALVNELNVRMIVIGRPVGLSGRAGPAIETQKGFVAAVRAAVAVEVVEYDERLTSVLAEQGLRAAGADRGARKRIKDALAAQVMLQGYLDGRA